MNYFYPKFRPRGRINNLLFLPFLFFNTLLFSQVGINTTNPTATLDVNGDLRIRQLDNGSGSHILGINEEGKVSKFKAYMLIDSDEIVAEDTVEEIAVGSEMINNIDLGLKIGVHIPKNTSAKVIVNYSVPMGTSLENNPESAYIGLTFLKDGIEIAQGSRKFTLPPLEYQTNFNISSMGTITNTYIENFEPAPNDRYITYQVMGYIEQHSSANLQYAYKFNMWNSGQNNYNWGKASVSYQTYAQ